MNDQVQKAIKLALDMGWTLNPTTGLISAIEDNLGIGISSFEFHAKVIREIEQEWEDDPRWGSKTLTPKCRWIRQETSYQCGDCNTTFRLRLIQDDWGFDKPDFCPYCGTSHVHPWNERENKLAYE